VQQIGVDRHAKVGKGVAGRVCDAWDSGGVGEPADDHGSVVTVGQTSPDQRGTRLSSYEERKKLIRRGFKPPLPVATTDALLGGPRVE